MSEPLLTWKCHYPECPNELNDRDYRMTKKWCPCHDEKVRKTTVIWVDEMVNIFKKHNELSLDEITKLTGRRVNSIRSSIRYLRDSGHNIIYSKERQKYYLEPKKI